MSVPERPGDPEGSRPAVATLRDYMRLLRRRWWIVLQAVILVPIVAVALSTRQPARYEAQSQVLLTYQTFTGLLTNQDNNPSSQLPDRVAATQATLARVPAVLKSTLTAVPEAGLTQRQLLDTSWVAASYNADILTFGVKAATPALAIKLASAYAKSYTEYRRLLDTAALQRARNDVSSRLTELRDNGQGQSNLAATLAEKQQELQTLETLQTSNATVVKNGSQAPQVAPDPIRNATLGLALGLVLGIALALLVDALDTRVRTGEEVAEILGISQLGGLPEPPKKLRKRNGLVMFEEPYGRRAEAFRMLRTNLELANIDLQAKVIAVASAMHAEGKSTTISNLAIAMARGGRRVALVDLDLRKPRLATYFHADVQWGVTDVALSRVRLDKALMQIDVRALPDGPPSFEDNRSRLDLMVAGPLPPNPGEFVASRRLGTILGQLRSRYDVVLIDTPPILSVGDALAMSAHVDGFMVVSNLAFARRGDLHKLRRALAFARCEILGLVVTSAGTQNAYGYAGAYYDDNNGRAVSEEIPPRATTSTADA